MKYFSILTYPENDSHPFAFRSEWKNLEDLKDQVFLCRYRPQGDVCICPLYQGQTHRLGPLCQGYLVRTGGLQQDQDWLRQFSRMVHAGFGKIAGIEKNI